MQRIVWRWIAAASVLALAASANARPRYGGTLRVETQAAPEVLSPTDERLGPLVFDRLIVLDERNRVRPGLAVAWEHDAGYRRWELRLRAGVRFHDGTPLDATAAGLSVGARTAGDRLVFERDRPSPDLLLELAGPAGAVVRLTGEGALVGSGPFRIARWEAGKAAVLEANAEHWAGRPFLEAIEAQMARPLRDQLVDLELGKADVVELAPDEARRASQRGVRVWASRPMTLVALAVTVEDTRVREALALAVDRGAIHSAVMQRWGEPAGGLLPNWLSGWAWLFPTGPDLERARRDVAGARPGPLVLAYDAADPAARLVAERVAVNAREAGLLVRPAAGAAHAEVRLMYRRIAPLGPARSLAQLATDLGLAAGNPATDEDAYQYERSQVGDFRVIPLVHLQDVYGLSRRVQDWSGRLWGNVWLEVSPDKGRP